MLWAMRSALLHRKIKGRCVRSSVSSAAGSSGKKQKVSITIKLRRHARSEAEERESGSERSSQGCPEIRRTETGRRRKAKSAGNSGMVQGTTVRAAVLSEGIADWE